MLIPLDFYLSFNNIFPGESLPTPRFTQRWPQLLGNNNSRTRKRRLSGAQWGAAEAQHIQRQNKQQAQLQQTPTQQTPTQQTPTQQGYQQFPQYGYYQQHQDQTPTPTTTYGYQQTYSGNKGTGKESSKSR